MMIDRGLIANLENEALLLNPGVRSRLGGGPIGSPLPPPPPPPAPAPVPPTPTPISTPPTVPLAPGSSPFDSLPFPSAGDRIKADDFKKLSQALKIVADMAALTAGVFGHTFGEARLAVASQGYQIARVMSVFGVEMSNTGDAANDARKVIQVLPTQLGNRALLVVVTEAVDTRKFVPNLTGLTNTQVLDNVRAMVGEITPSGPPPSAPSLVGLTLADAQSTLTR